LLFIVFVAIPLLGLLEDRSIEPVPLLSLVPIVVGNVATLLLLAGSEVNVEEDGEEDEFIIAVLGGTKLGLTIPFRLNAFAEKRGKKEEDEEDKTAGPIANKTDTIIRLISILIKKSG
jgi:hypothetical protein